MRSSDRNVWQEAGYSAPSGTPRADKGANHDNVLSKMYKSLSDVEISVTTFGGGPIERFQVDGDSVPTDWSTGQPNTRANFIACSVNPGGLRRRESHDADRLRSDDIQLAVASREPTRAAPSLGPELR